MPAKALRVLLINILLSIIVIGFVSFTFTLDKFWPFLLPEALMVAAWPLMAAGILLILFSAITLARYSSSSGAPGDLTKELVTQGPYRWTRNPIYLGDGILILGLTFLTRSPSLLISCMVFVIVMHVLVRKVEEPDLEKRFGEQYIEYKKQVPRWFPKIV
jgi:protein-S-isoprenylcysteine O-methyltransferase Ste14